MASKTFTFINKIFIQCNTFTEFSCATINYSQDSYFILRKKVLRVLPQSFQHQYSPSLGREFRRSEWSFNLNTKEHNIGNTSYIHRWYQPKQKQRGLRIWFYHSQQVNFPFIKRVLKGQITLARQQVLLQIISYWNFFSHKII